MSSGVTDGWAAAFVASEAEPEHVEAWVERTASAIVASTPDLARDPDLAEALNVTVREQWQAFLATLADPEPSVTVVPSATALAAELARRHIDLPVLLGAYRTAQRESWAYAVAIVADAPTEVDRTGLLIDFWTRAGNWFDTVTEASIVVHQEERRRIRHSGTAQRFEVVRSLLAGDDPEPRDLAAAISTYPLSATHTAVLLRAVSPAATPQLEPTAHALAAGISSGRPLLVEPGGRELWMWLPAARADRLRAEDVPPGLVVAIGDAGEGLPGFRLTHQEALEAQRVSLAQPQPAPLTAYADVASLALLSRDPAAAERFVTRVLGRLAADTAQAARMRETLRVVLAHPGHTEAAASALHIHKNTVRYRVAQAERALWYAVPERGGDLELALRYYDTFLAGGEATVIDPAR
jgi:hypothetical protein